MDKKWNGLWSEICACTYCKFYIEPKINASYLICSNLKSPYNLEITDDVGTGLFFYQQLKGCDLIEYDGRKIPQFLFAAIPKDSCLRKIPIENLVDNIEKGRNLESDLSVVDFDTEKARKIIEKSLNEKK